MLFLLTKHNPILDLTKLTKETCATSPTLAPTIPNPNNDSVPTNGIRDLLRIVCL